MTGDGHAVDAGSLTRASTDLAAVAQAIGQGLDRLSTALNGQTGALGTDEVSGPFAREYGPLFDQAMKAIGSYQDQIRYASDGLAGTVELVQRTEDTNTDAMVRLRAPWQPAPPP